MEIFTFFTKEKKYTREEQILHFRATFSNFYV